MTCASGGALDIYMDPHMPKAQPLWIGAPPINAALQQLAPVLDFAVSQVDDSSLQQARIDERTFVVIATHGLYDEIVLEHVLVSPAAYIGMVSSPRRAEACRNYLRESGLSEAQIARLRAPAGLDLGARTPAEIATSILAELVQLRSQTRTGEAGASNVTEPTVPAQLPTPEAVTPAMTQPTEATDPVCGMSVEIAGALHTSVHNGR